MANFCNIKTDKHIFKTIVKNIFLIFEKYTNNSEIQIKVDLIPNVENTDEINQLKVQLMIIANNCLSYSHSKKDANFIQSMNIINVIKQNNNLLAKHINCDYEELYRENANLLKYTLTFSSFNIDNYNSGNMSTLISRERSNAHNLNIDKNMVIMDRHQENISKKKVSFNLQKKTSHKSILNQSYSSNNEMIKIKEKTNSNLNSTSEVFEYKNKELVFGLIQENTEINIDHKDIDINNSKINNFGSSKVNKKEDISNKSNECDCFRILIVDDDYLCVNYLKNVIKGIEPKYDIAYDGYEALEKVKSLSNKECKVCSKKLLIFMDIQMPILNGIKSAKLIDSHLEKAHLLDCKLYFLSANIESQFIKEIQDISVYRGFFNKPIKKADILKVIHQNK